MLRNTIRTKPWHADAVSVNTSDYTFVMSMTSVEYSSLFASRAPRVFDLLHLYVNNVDYGPIYITQIDENKPNLTIHYLPVGYLSLAEDHKLGQMASLKNSVSEIEGDTYGNYI